MKKIIMIFGFIIALCSCKKETPCTVTDDINQLKQIRNELQSEVWKLGDAKSAKLQTIDSLNKELKFLNIYTSGRTPQYILKMKLKQSHFSLDIGKHIKDAMNAIEFELPVDKDFYNKVEVGTEIVDDFRTGSFILHGSIGSWKMTVEDKEIR